MKSNEMKPKTPSDDIIEEYKQLAIKNFERGKEPNQRRRRMNNDEILFFPWIFFIIGAITEVISDIDNRLLSFFLTGIVIEIFVLFVLWFRYELNLRGEQ